MGPPDTGLFRIINQWPQSLGPFMRFVSEALSYPSVKVALGVLLAAMFYANAGTRRTAFQALVAVGIANPITDLMKAIWPMARPFQELKHVNMWVGLSPSHGTASAHSANMAAVAFVFVYHLRWWGSPWVAVALITGFSRVYCGAHYPYQVLLGWMVGVLAGLAATKGWEWIVSKRTASKPAAPVADQFGGGALDSSPEG